MNQITLLALAIVLALCACKHKDRVAAGKSAKPTGVFVNGHELTPAELKEFRQILPGLFTARWTMARNGDFGPEGEPPVLNLVVVMQAKVAAQVRAQRQAEAQAMATMRMRAMAVQQMYASQGWGWNSGAGYMNGNWAQGNYQGALSTYERTGTGVYGDSNGLVGVMTEGGSWYPGQ